MSLAYLTPKGKIIKANGTDVLSSQNVPYSLSNTKFDAEGQLIEFTINNASVTDLENSYIFVDKSHYYPKVHKENGITGYLKKSFFIKLKNNASKTYYEINDRDNIDLVWFDNHLNSASVGDIFYTEQIICDLDSTNHTNINTYVYFKYLRQSFRIKDNNQVEYRDYKTYPQNNETNEQSPDYNKKEILPTNRLDNEEGNFFKVNIEDIRLLSISPDSKKSLYKKLSLLCFSIYWIRQEVLDIIAIRPINEIQIAVNNGTIFSSNSQQQPLFSEIDRVVGQLLIDWGYKDQISAKKIIAIPNAADEFYNGYYEAYNNYKLALDNFYHNLRVKNEAGLFPDNDSESRIEVLKDILPSSAWSILPYSFRRNIIDKYIQEDSLKGEAETQCLRIIHSFYLVPTEGEEFLNYLLYKRDGTATNFEKLFHLFDDETISQISPVVGFFAQEKSNRRSFVYALYEIWKRTKYDFRYIPPNTSPDPDGVNPNAFFLSPQGLSYYKNDEDKKYFLTLETGTIDLPSVYPGNSPGIGTKEFIDTSFIVDKNLHGEKVHITRAIKHKFDSMNQDNIYLGNGPAGYDINEQMYLHLYQPINLINFKPEEDLKSFLPEDPLIPSFVYYYCNEYDRIKDINAAWSFTIDVTIEIGLFFILGGTSVIKDLRYLGRVTEIGKALRNATTATDAVLTIRGLEAGTEIFTLTSAMAWSASYYVQTASNDPATKAAAAKVGFLFFCLTMLGAGATIFARRQATRAAREVLADAHFDTMPASVKQVVTHLTNADTVALASFKSRLQQNNQTNVYNGVIAMTAHNGVDLQKAFYAEFSKATKAELDILNGNTGSISNWESLFKKGIADRTSTSVISQQNRVNAIVRYYTLSNSKIRTILEKLDFKKRWEFLDEFGNVDNIVFDELKLKPIGVNALLDVKTLPKNSKDMFDVDDIIAIIKAKLPTEHHLGCLVEKNKLEWFKSIKSYTININCEFITSIQLKNLHDNFSDFFIGAPDKIFKKFKSKNRLFAKVECYLDNNLVEPATFENYLSGYKDDVDIIFEDVPNLKQYFTEPDDYEKFTEFARNAFDNKGKTRFNDTEVKFLYNFFVEHYHKGNRFEIQLESVLYTCKSCQKYLQAAKNYAKSQGKVIDFKFISHHQAKQMTDVKELIQ